MGEKYYFAYSSNLNIFQMMKRVGEWATSKRAYLEGYKLVFNVKSSRWDGYTANVQKTRNSRDKVYGVIYLLREEKIAVLTSYEGENSGPMYRDVKLEDGSVIHDVAVYRWDKDKPSEKPPKIYQDTILEGLKQHGYTEDIIKKVQREFFQSPD